MGIRKDFISKMTQSQLYIIEFNIKWVDMTVKDELELDDLIVKVQLLDLPWMEMIPNEPLPPIQEPDRRIGSIIDLPTPSQLREAQKPVVSPKGQKVSPKGGKKGAKKINKPGVPEDGSEQVIEVIEPPVQPSEPHMAFTAIGEPKNPEDEKLKLLMMLEPPMKLVDPPKGVPFNSTRSCMFAWGGALRLIHTLQRQPVLIRLTKMGKAKSVAEASIWLGSDFFEAAAQAAVKATTPTYAYQQGAYDLFACRASSAVIGSIIMSVRLSCYGICAKSKLKSPGGDLMDRVPWLTEYKAPDDFDPALCGWQEGQESRDVCDLAPAIAAPIMPALKGSKPVPPRPQVPSRPPTPEPCAEREACTNMIATRFQTKAMLAQLHDLPKEKE